MINAGNLVWVALGGMAGSVLRYITYIIFQKFDADLWPTLAVNIAGSFLFGVVLAWLARPVPYSEPLKLLLLVGFCGGFTTFSTFSAEGWQLLKDHQFARLLLYYGVSAIGGIIAIAAGYLIFQASNEQL